MSKPLHISAAFAIFAMAAFTLFATPAAEFAFADHYIAATQTGATTNVAAPAIDRFLPVLSGLIR